MAPTTRRRAGPKAPKVVVPAQSHAQHSALAQSTGACACDGALQIAFAVSSPPHLVACEGTESAKTTCERQDTPVEEDGSART